jgi:GTP cyclohydrolase IA
MQATAEEKSKYLQNIFSEAGIDLTDNNYQDTPERFGKFLKEFTYGLTDLCQKEIQENLEVQFDKHNRSKQLYGGMLVQSPIRAYSVCSHHFLPIIYDISFAYIPDTRLVGFSKITKVIRLIAKKPSNQEDFTQEIIEVFTEYLKPKGLAVVVSGIHMCMKMRGVESDAINKTSAVRGDFKDYERTRDEFLHLANQTNVFI